MASILVVDDDDLVLESLRMVLKEAGHKVRAVNSPRKALSLLEKGDYDLVITDMRMPEMSGIEFLEKVKEKDQGLPVIMITAYGTVDTAVTAMKKGASDYIMKPFSADELEVVVEKALEAHRLREENVRLKELVRCQAEVDEEFIGESAPIKALKRELEKIARSDATVLVMGETGTGKELIARRIHALSQRAEGPYVRVNCAAIPDTLVEAELFGHEKGAFTGAVYTRKGKFELAHGGTILLDEIGEMPLHLQAKLLRVLQEGEVDRIGGSSPVKVDVRVVATTNRDLAQEVKEGRFREDLFFRLNVVPIYVPPLRERKEDIPLLAEAFLRRYSRKMGKEIKGITDSAMKTLLDYDWPGNVRELENCIHRAVVLCEGSYLEEELVSFPYSLGFKRSH